MPAKSKSQQRFMGMVHGLQKGTVKSSDVSGKVKKTAKSMKKKDAEDYASTKHKGLPNKVRKEMLDKLKEIVKQELEETFYDGTKKFEKKRTKSAEVLGYTLTGTPDVKADLNSTKDEERVLKRMKGDLKEALLSENPAASAAAAMVMMQMQNPDTGRKIKAITPLKDKDHKLHGKAKGIFQRLKDKFKKKKDEPQSKADQYKALMKKTAKNEDVGMSTYLGGIIQSMRKAGLKPKTAKQMKWGFSKSKDKIGFFIDVEQRSFNKKEKYTLQVEIDRDGNLWYLSGHRPMKLGKWSDTSKMVRMWKTLNKVRGFGQAGIFKKNESVSVNEGGPGSGPKPKDDSWDDEEGRAVPKGKKDADIDWEDDEEAKRQAFKDMEGEFDFDESVNEARGAASNKGAAVYINTFEKLLKKQMGSKFGKSQPTEKDIEKVFGLMRKRYGELESVNEGKKRFKVGFNIGKAKYVISHHDGRQKHKDGSDFFGISIYKNQKAFEKGQEDLKKKGYIEESVNEGINDKMKTTMTKLAKSLGIKSVVNMYTGKGSLSYMLDDDREAKKLQKFLQRSFKRVRLIPLDKSRGDEANWVVAADMLGLESVNEAGLGDKFQKNIKKYQDRIEKEREAYKKAREAQKKRNNESVNEVSGVDVAKKVLKNKQMEKGIDLQTANLIVTIDKAYDKNRNLQKKFRAIQLPKMKQLIMRYYG